MAWSRSTPQSAQAEVDVTPTNGQDPGSGVQQTFSEAFHFREGASIGVLAKVHDRALAGGGNCMRITIVVLAALLATSSAWPAQKGSLTLACNGTYEAQNFGGILTHSVDSTNDAVGGLFAVDQVPLGLLCMLLSDQSVKATHHSSANRGGRDIGSCSFFSLLLFLGQKT
jgi:hypothetical protein